MKTMLEKRRGRPATGISPPVALRIQEQRGVIGDSLHVPVYALFNRRLQRNHTFGGCDFLSGDTGLIKPTAIPSGSSMIA